MAGIYIHIPFCGSRCKYCAFFSTVQAKNDSCLDIYRKYVNCVIEELKKRKTEITEPIGTIYIGGGTPSLLTPMYIEVLLEAIHSDFQVEHNAEITLEGNPEDLTADYLSLLYNIGINRLSIGIQSFDDSLLRLLGRRHNARRAIDAVNTAYSLGFENITVDLMYGLPNQTEEMWAHDVDYALSLPIKHLSAYCLNYEAGTPFYEDRHKGRINITDDEVCNKMYDLLCEHTSVAGMMQYETSNFARHGYRSRHNSAYWDGVAYLGAGAAAHSYDGRRIRRWNVSDLEKYISSHANDYDTECLTDSELYDEMIMLGLRRIEGIDLNRLKSRFGGSMMQYCLKEAERFLQTGHLVAENNRLCVSHEGMKILNYITAQLFS